MTGPIAAIDGFARVAAAAVVWAGVLAIIDRTDRLASVLAIAAITLLIGLGFAEYALGLFPILLIALWPAALGDGRRWRLLFGMFAIMTVTFGVYYLARTHAVPPTLDAKRLALDPRTWVTNLGLLAAALSFPGDTAWVFTHRSTMVYAIFAAGALCTIGFISTGWGWASDDAPDATTAALRRRLPLLLAASTFPMVILGKISEMYVPQLLVPFALVLGCAVDGWWQRRQQVAATVVLAVGAAVSIAAIRSKIGDLVDAGQRAHVLTTDVLAHVPAHAEGCRYAVVFDHRQQGPSYSVFILSDLYLIQPDHGHFFMDFERPGQAVGLDTILDDDARASRAGAYDVVFDWHPDVHRVVARPGVSRCDAVTAVGAT